MSETRAENACSFEHLRLRMKIALHALQQTSTLTELQLVIALLDEIAGHKFNASELFWKPFILSNNAFEPEI